MKRLMNLWLMATFVCSLALGVTSCKDDDDVAEANTKGKATED